MKMRQAEAEKRLLDAARSLLESGRGLTISLGSLSYEEVIREARVPRSTAYRIWDTKQKFEDAFLADLASPEGNYYGVDTTAELLAEAYRSFGPVAADDHVRRRARVEELANAGAQVNLEEVMQNPNWTVYAAIVTTSESSTVEGLLGSLQTGEERFIDRMAGFYEIVCRLLGLRLRPSREWRQLAVAGAAYIEGLALRRFLMPDALSETLKGDGQDWTLAGLGFVGLIDQFVEEDPDWEILPDDQVDSLIADLKSRGTWLRPKSPIGT